MILFKDFIKKYPVCPTCSGSLEMKSVQHKSFDIRCKQGHYTLNIDDNYKLVNCIWFITADYDISIILEKIEGELDWIRISYGFQNEVERTMDCYNYEKWMLSYDDMMDKLKTLWSLA